jgi:hypothetical protein
LLGHVGDVNRGGDEFRQRGQRIGRAEDESSSTSHGPLGETESFDVETGNR